jgi:DNA ligase (NAD+)
MDIEHLGYKTGILFLDKGWVEDPSDIYSITREQLADLPGFKEKSIENLMRSIEASKDRPLWRLLVALNTPHVGSTVAQLIARRFPSIDEIRAASLEDLNAIEGIGPEISQSVAQWFADEENGRLLDGLRAAGVRMKDDVVEAPAEGPLTGQSIVITGGLDSMPRSEAEHAAEQAGAKVTSSVSKKTSFVVVGEGPGSKLDRARELGVETIDEEEFLRRLKG